MYVMLLFFVLNEARPSLSVTMVLSSERVSPFSVNTLTEAPSTGLPLSASTTIMLAKRVFSNDL